MSPLVLGQCSFKAPYGLAKVQCNAAFRKSRVGFEREYEAFLHGNALLALRCLSLVAVGALAHAVVPSKATAHEKTSWMPRRHHRRMKEPRRAPEIKVSNTL